jgi:acyl carrier protein
MSPAEIKKAVLQAIGEIAPEADPNTIRSDLPLREQLDIDSFDFLNLLVRVHEALGVEIPESDYAKVATLDAFVAYLTTKKSVPA